MNKKVKILIICMIFVVSGVFGQTSYYKIQKDTSYLIRCYSPSKFIKFSKKNTCDSLQKNKAIPFKVYLYSPSIIPSNYYTQNFGFFCKKELQLEKAIKFPVKFRLGSVEQCDWLEGM